MDGEEETGGSVCVRRRVGADEDDDDEVESG